MGPRVLASVYLNAVASIPLWGLDWHLAPFYALPETLSIGVAWLLLRRHQAEAGLPDFASLLRFMLLGVLVPVTLVSLGVQGSLLATGVITRQAWLLASLQMWLGDSLTTLVLSLPLLVYGTPGCAATAGRSASTSRCRRPSAACRPGPSCCCRRWHCHC